MLQVKKLYTQHTKKTRLRNIYIYFFCCFLKQNEPKLPSTTFWSVVIYINNNNNNIIREKLFIWINNSALVML